MTVLEFVRRIFIGLFYKRIISVCGFDNKINAKSVAKLGVFEAIKSWPGLKDLSYRNVIVKLKIHNSVGDPKYCNVEYGNFAGANICSLFAWQTSLPISERQTSTGMRCAGQIYCYYSAFRYVHTSPRYRNTSSASRRGMRTPCASDIFCKFARTDIAQVGSVLCGAQKKTQTPTLECLCLFLVTRTGIEPMLQP